MMRIGALRHRVTLEAPTTVPDGRGTYTQTWEPLVPAQVWAAVEPATPRAVERLIAGVVAANITHVVTIRFHAGVTTKTRITFNGRYLFVRGLQNVEELSQRVRLACEEAVS
jgi:SPP1 family predicted phage head-tail adaptor